MGQAQRSRAAQPGQRSIGGKVLNLTRRTWARYWTRRAEHATVAVLQALDDRALKDIGIDRSEIETVMYRDRKAGRGCCDRTSFSERRICMC